jgi:SAM-dependent methyltransferase
MKAVASDYANRLGTINVKEPQVPFYSSVSGELCYDFSASYWVQNFVSPVLFKSAVQAVLANPPSNIAFVEVGPHSALAGPTRQILQGEGKSAEYIATLVRDADGLESVLRTAGNLWLAGFDVNLSAVNPPGEFLTDLPTYAWYYSGEYWFETRLSRDWRFRKFDHHELLGTRILESADAGPAWRCKLRVEDAPWLRDHDILGDVIFPGAGYICMAGEAVKQLAGSKDYSLRRVTFASALVLHDESIEIVTTLIPARLSTTLDSEWYDFSISSVNGDVWTKHVSGQVRPGSEFAQEAPEIEPLPRKVATSALYSIWRKFGLNYGERFRGLSDISSHTTEMRAVGAIYDKCSPQESAVYAIHPASIDAGFHLSNVCICRGLGRNFKTPSVPKYIDEMYVGNPEGPIQVTGDAAKKGRGGSTSNLLGVSNGKVVLSWKGLDLVPLSDGSEVIEDDPHAGAVLQWRTDLDFIDAGRLLRPLNKDYEDVVNSLVDRMGLACIIESRAQLAGVETSQWYLQKFREWMDIPYTEAVEGRYSRVPDCAVIAAMSSEARTKLIDDMLDSSVGTSAHAVAIALHRSFTNSIAFFRGEADPLEVLMADNILMRMYDFTNNSDHSEFFTLLGHKKPNMKVLEIGAGTGGTTATILPALKSDQGERMYGTYVYTDISAGFFLGAKERFKDYQAIEFSVLDIMQDPAAQGFELESFDLIIASNVLHATPNLVHTLTNVRKLLHPEGRLFMLELSPVASKSVNYVMGPLVGWWLSEDGRDDEPYVSPEIWDKRLKQSGFAGVDAWAYDGNMINSIIAKPAALPTKKITKVSIVCSDSKHHRVEEAAKSLRSKGLDLEFFSVGQLLPPGRPAVFLMDLEAPFLVNITEEKFNAFKASLFSIQDTSFLWVTGACQVDCKTPNYSLVNGMGRTIRGETGIDLVTLELETFDESGWTAVSDLLTTFLSRATGGEIDPDVEYVFNAGTLQVGRMHWINVFKELQDQKEEGLIKKLVIKKPGIMQTLHWKQMKPTPANGDSVLVETRAVGLNFKV